LLALLVRGEIRGKGNNAVNFLKSIITLGVFIKLYYKYMIFQVPSVYCHTYKWTKLKASFLYNKNVYITYMTKN